MSDFSKNILVISMLAGTLVFPISGCKQPPSPPARAPGTSIALSYASFEWKTEQDFKRISEYFTGEENTGTHLVLRTNPAVREGLYLTISIEAGAKIPENSIAELRYFQADKRGEQVKTWKLPEFTGTLIAEIRLGLTGEAWPEKNSETRPTAWKITVTSPAGEKLIERKSYLWEIPQETPPEMPAKKQENERVEK